MSRSVCLSVSEPHSRTSPNILRMLPIVVAWSSSDGVTIMLCASGFVDDVVFSRSELYGAVFSSCERTDTQTDMDLLQYFAPLPGRSKIYNLFYFQPRVHIL